MRHDPPVRSAPRPPRRALPARRRRAPRVGGARPLQRHRERRHRRGQDHRAQRARRAAPRRRAHRHRGGHGRAPPPGIPRGAPRSAAGHRRWAGRHHDPPAGAQRPPHAPRSDHRRRGQRRRGGRHALGDEHGPRGLVVDVPRQLAPRRPPPARDDGALGRPRPPDGRRARPAQLLASTSWSRSPAPAAARDRSCRSPRWSIRVEPDGPRVRMLAGPDGLHDLPLRSPRAPGAAPPDPGWCT